MGELTRKRWRDCWLLLLTFIRVPSFTKTCPKIHNLFVRAGKHQRMGIVERPRHGRQRETMVPLDSYPARLQQLPLASDAVLDVDQTQQVFLTHTHTQNPTSAPIITPMVWSLLPVHGWVVRCGLTGDAEHVRTPLSRLDALIHERTLFSLKLLINDIITVW